MNCYLDLLLLVKYKGGGNVKTNKFTIIVIVNILLITVFSGAVFSQERTIDQWIDLLAKGKPEAISHFGQLGTDALPVLQDLLAEKWVFWSFDYIPQRRNVVKALAAINDPVTIPVLKLALIQEPVVARDAMEAVFALEAVDNIEFFSELLTEQANYQTIQIEMLNKIIEQDLYVDQVLTQVFDYLAAENIDGAVIERTAELLTRFILTAEGEREQVYRFYLEQLQDPNQINRALALKSIGRLADTARGLQQSDEFALTQFVPGLLEILEDEAEITNNRILAALALEQVLPTDQDTLRTFVKVLSDVQLDNRIKWPLVRALETAGVALNNLVYDLWSNLPMLESAMQWRLASLFVHISLEDPQLVDYMAANKANHDPEYVDKILQAVRSFDHSSLEEEPLLRAVNTSLPAFPGAEGKGALASGGRGGEVYIVTNIKDSGPGSFRDAVSEPNRTVVFGISGTIEAQREIKTAPNITIAGQTAPGDGIAITNNRVVIGGDNSIVRFIRFRLGTRGGQKGDTLSMSNVKNVILDHISASWGVDEVFSAYNNENVTVQYSMFGEGLNWENHSCVGLWGPLTTYHHNLIYSNKTRHPKLAYLDGQQVDFINNTVYNWWQTSVYTGSKGDINFIGNYFKPGPSTNANVRDQLIAPGSDIRLYIADNMLADNELITADNWLGVTKPAERINEPFSSVPITIHDAQQAHNIVLEQAGAYLPKRDAVDERVINEVINATGQIVIRESEVGGYPILNSELAPVDTDEDGMPDMWEIYQGLNIFDANDRNSDRIGDGYTNLEEYLNAIITPHVLWP